MPHLASCPECGWTRDYASLQSRWTGLRRHRARECRPPGQTSERRAKAAQRTAERAAEREAASWSGRIRAAGLPVEVPDAAWVAHPYALDDLLRVLGGTSLNKIAAERRLLRELDEGAA